LEGSPNVEFRATGNTYVKIWKVKFNKFINEPKYIFSRRWSTRRRAFINGVHNDVSRALRFEEEHLFETFYHGMIIRLPNSTIVASMELGQDVTTEIWPSGELDEEGREQIVESLLVNVPKIEIKIGNQGLPNVVQGYDILNNRGTKVGHVNIRRQLDERKDEPKHALSRARYEIQGCPWVVAWQILRGTYVFRVPIRRNQRTSSPWIYCVEGTIELCRRDEL
jgi:hypothetical protein